jgi:hypothetical protein
MLSRLWNRLMRRHEEGVSQREDEEMRMSDEERRFVEERVEDHRFDSFTEQRFLGGPDPPSDVDEGPRND